MEEKKDSIAYDVIDSIALKISRAESLARVGSDACFDKETAVSISALQQALSDAENLFDVLREMMEDIGKQLRH